MPPFSPVSHLNSSAPTEETDLEDLHPSLEDLKTGRKTSTADGLAEKARPLDNAAHKRNPSRFGGHKDDYDTLYAEKSPFLKSPPPLAATAATSVGSSSHLPTSVLQGSSPDAKDTPMPTPPPNTPSYASERPFVFSPVLALILLTAILVMVVLLFRMIRVAGQRRKEAQYVLLSHGRAREL